MTKSHLDYSKWVEEALRIVVRRALEAATEGLPGTHHFYVTFRTDAPEVEIPDYLHVQYPREMTIVLQHQYWDLKVFSQHFEITLSFNRVNATLRIPFAAITAFNDPSVNFGLQLQMSDGNAPETDGANADSPETPQPQPQLAAKAKPALPMAMPEAEKASTPPLPASTDETAEPQSETADGDDDDDDPKEGRVIALDAFRKK